MGTSAERENKIAEFFNITRDELMINDYSTERVADNENEDNLKQLIRNNTILVETNQRLVERILILTDKKTESDTAEVV
ncbi:MAG: hypothetical protein ACLVKO_10225 [Dysgonomonas sp.]